MIDADGYPADETIRLIEEWARTPRALVVDVLEPVFARFGDVTRTGTDDAVEVVLVTGGWSGCEAAITALKHTMFWILFWRESHRGGRHVFRVPDDWWGRTLTPLPRRPDDYALGWAAAVETLRTLPGQEAAVAVLEQHADAPHTYRA